MGRKTLNRQIEHALHDKIAFGESRHAAKNDLRDQLGDNFKFGMTDDKIHSINTFDTYKDACNKFADWLVNDKKLNKYTNFKDCEQYAREYIKHRLNDDKVSVWTAKMERSALSKLYNKTIEVEMPKRDIKDIKRSRGEEKVKHFQEKNHPEEVTLARATGCRRCDLLAIKPRDFWEDRSGNMWVNIYASKGGRDRTAPVLPAYKEYVKNYIQDKPQDKPLFTELKQHMDVHSYRDAYAVELYRTVRDNQELKEQLLKQYPERHEYKTIRDKETGEKKTIEIKSDTITTRRGEESRTFDRDDVYICTQALGHNRLDVCITHYLFNA